MLQKIKRILYRSILNNDIDYQQAKQIMKNSQDTILLDVRSKQEYQEGHLPSSVNISLYDLKNQAMKRLPDKKSNIIIYCSSGNRSKQAQEILKNLGYENVYNLKGGLQSINEEF